MQLKEEVVVLAHWSARAGSRWCFLLNTTARHHLFQQLQKARNWTWLSQTNTRPEAATALLSADSKILCRTRLSRSQTATTTFLILFTFCSLCAFCCCFQAAPTQFCFAIACVRKGWHHVLKYTVLPDQFHTCLFNAAHAEFLSKIFLQPINRKLNKQRLLTDKSNNGRHPCIFTRSCSLIKMLFLIFKCKRTYWKKKKTERRTTPARTPPPPCYITRAVDRKVKK